VLFSISRSQWPRGIRRMSAAAWLLGSRVRIPLRALMVVTCVSMLSCVGKSLCSGLIAWPDKFYDSSNCVIEKHYNPQYRRGQGSNVGCSARRDYSQCKQPLLRCLLTFYSLLITICSPDLTVNNSELYLTKRVYRFHIILRVNSDYFLKRY
jgi:hypothetical protein